MKTSAEVTLNGGEKDQGLPPKSSKNSGLGIIRNICPDSWNRTQLIYFIIPSKK